RSSGAGEHDGAGRPGVHVPHGLLDRLAQLQVERVDLAAGQPHPPDPVGDLDVNHPNEVTRPGHRPRSPSQPASLPARLTARRRRSACSRTLAVTTISSRSPVRSTVVGPGTKPWSPRTISATLAWTGSRSSKISTPC